MNIMKQSQAKIQTSIILMLVAAIIIIPYSFINQAWSDIQINNEPPEYLGCDNLELNTKTNLCGGWNVEFQHIKRGLTEQVFNISIQNLYDTNRDFNLTQIIEPLTHSVNDSDTNLYEWKGILTNITDYIEVNATIEQNCSDDGNITYYDCSYNITPLVENGSHEEYILQWKPAKAQLTKERTEFELKENMQLINIPKYNSKYKEADGTYNGTKFFQVRIQTPIIETEHGWGSSGIFKIETDSCLFYDLMNSSWWNETFGCRVNFTVSNLLTTEYQLKLNFNESDFESSCTIGTDNEIRFVDESGSKMDFWIEEGNWTNDYNNTVWINVSTNGTKSMYYGNTSIVSSESDIKNTFMFGDDFNAASLDTTDRWDNTKAANVAIVSGEAEIDADNDNGLYSKTSFSGNFVYESIFKHTQNTNHNQIPFSFHQSEAAFSAYFLFKPYSTFDGYNKGIYRYDDGASTPVINTNTDFTPNQYHFARFIKKGANTFNFTIWQGTNDAGIYKYSVQVADWKADDSIWIGIVFYEATTNKMYVDDIRVRKYLTTVPTYSFGVEETPADIDSCTPPASGTWTINSTDNCLISSETINVDYIYFTDDGTIIFDDCIINTKAFERKSGDGGTDTIITLYSTYTTIKN